CNFELHQCGWVDFSSRNYKWKRNRNETFTAATGPAVDHTLGSNLGYYMAAELSGEVLSTAVMAIRFQQSAPSCEMHFWYHMWGTGVSPGSLAVSIIETSRAIEIWSVSKDMGNQWNHEVLHIGRYKENFEVNILRLTAGFYSMEGDIALDDIEFAHCGLPEPKLSCSTNELQCQRGSCVSLDRLCDFSDDCGDQTDEKHCEHYMGCDFENGLCNWEQEVDEDDLSWTHNSPSNIFNLLPDTGSKRDHTWNLDTGFYVYLDTSFSKEGRKAWLKSPALYASSENACKLRFFYHMHGKNIGSLKVYTRVFNDGTLMERWTRSGEVGNYFVRTEVILPAGQPFQVI
uniref:MAM domain-containing protein n=1 Tax=Latimeria chalumnae TaxID=7897 RepID=H3B4N7_LATCH